MKTAFWLGIFLLLTLSSAQAFFLTVVQKEGGYALKGQEVFWTIFRSDPFRGILYDLKAPKTKVFIGPKEVRPIALRRIQAFDYASGKKRYAWQARFIPDAKGDYYLVLVTEPTLTPSTEVWKEIVKVPLHVETKGRWEEVLGLEAEIRPLVRPYGLSVGEVFSGEVIFQGRPVPRARLQVVPYLGRYLRLSDLPRDGTGKPDFPAMYLELLTDDQGRFSLSFPHPGWWLVSAILPTGNFTIGQNTYPFFWRASLWLYIRPLFLPTEKAPRLRFGSN